MMSSGGKWLHAVAGIPLPIRVLTSLVLGFALGLFFPHSSVVQGLYLSGTYFPRLIVTLAALLVFHLLTAALAKLILYHRDRAGKLFFHIVGLYVVMGFVSLVYVTVWLGAFSHTPWSRPGVPLPSVISLIRQIVSTLSHVLSQQPMLQALAAATLIGWLTATLPALHSAAYGFIAAGDWILNVFRKLLWYYPS